MSTRRRVQEFELEILNQNIDREERRLRREVKAKKKLDMEGQAEHVGIGIEGEAGGVYQHEAPQPNIPPQQPVFHHQQDQPPSQYPQQPYAPHYIPQPQYEPPPMPQHNHQLLPPQQQGQHLQRQSIQDMCRPSYADFRQGVAAPSIQANNFELKPSYIQLVQNEQFGGGSSEDPMNHLRKVELVSKLIKLNGVTQDAISMRLFPFSLRGKALSWYERLNSSSIVSWNDLCNAFLGEFYPPSLYMHYRSELTNFRRKASETLYESWERYKDLIDKCPNHQMPKWLLVQTFYRSCPSDEKSTLDASANGSLMRLHEDEAYMIIEYVATNRSLWDTRGDVQSVRYIDQPAKLDTNIDSLIARKVEETLKSKLNNGDGAGSSSFNHPEYDGEQVNAINNFSRSERAVMGNTYNPSWRNHPNLSWGGNHGGGYQGNQGYQTQTL